MGGKKKQTVGYRYFLGMHLALCYGPIDKIISIFGDDKLAWAGESTGGSIVVNNTELFGGTDKEGGLAGQIDFEFGGPTQNANPYLVEKLSPNLVPAYRGVAAAVLRQFYVGTQSYLKKLSFLASRIHTRTIDGIPQWYDEKAQVLSFVNPPAVLFTENFGTDEDTDFAEYVTELGSRTAFDVVDSGIGPLAMLTKATGLASSSVIARDIPTGYFVGCSFKFALDTIRSDDAGVMAFTDASGDVAFTFTVCREAAYDSLRRCHCVFSGGTGLTNPIGTVGVTVGVWYTCDVSYDANSGSFNLVIKELSSGTVFATLNTTATINNISKLKFVSDGGLNAGDALLTDIVVYTQITTQDMNPAHIIRECLTDPDWGMGYQDADIDDVSFQAAADKLFSEGMGISIIWSRQTSIEDFIKEIIRHIDATLFVDKSNGKFTLILIRDDYDESDLLVLDENNIERISDFTRPSTGELTNSITVQFYDASTFKDSSLTVQDIALSQMQGTTINTTVQYPGFTNSGIAARVAQRDLKTVSTPIVSCTIYANRDAAELNIGKAFKLSWPDYEIDNLVMRVTGIAYGDGRNNRVRLTCTQDVYRLPAAAIVVPVAPVWTDPNGAPVAAQNRLPYEVPYLEAVQQSGQASVDNVLSLDPAIGLAGIAVARPSSSSINAHMYTDAGGGYNDQAIIDFSPFAKLTNPIGKMDTTFDIDNVAEIDNAPIGSWFQIDGELMSKVSYVAPTLTVKRGLLDTVPEEHAAGAKIFFWDNYSANDETQYVSGETIDIKVTPVTGLGELALIDAPVDTLEIVGRMARPYPAADFKINSAYFPAAATLTLDFTWVHRDRKQQTGNVYLGFTDASVGPEAGTTYNLRIYKNSDNTLLYSNLGITGNSLLGVSLSTSNEIRIEHESERDGLVSYQKIVHVMTYSVSYTRIAENGDRRITEDGADVRITE